MDTIFHVTINPSVNHYQKCQRNIEQGKKVYLIVPRSELDGVIHSARTILGQDIANKISIVSIESFVGQNIDEISTFSKNQAKNELFNLLTTYNERVNAIESDKSKLIEIPPNLYIS